MNASPSKVPLVLRKAQTSVYSSHKNLQRIKNMEIAEPIPERQPSQEMRAVLKIINASDELKRKVLPHIDINREAINWPKIWSNDFAGGHSGALLWAQAIWLDKVATRHDPFDRAFAMDGPLQVAVIEALAMRWGIMK